MPCFPPYTHINAYTKLFTISFYPPQEWDWVAKLYNKKKFRSVLNKHFHHCCYNAVWFQYPIKMKQWPIENFKDVITTKNSLTKKRQQDIRLDETLMFTKKFLTFF